MWKIIVIIIAVILFGPLVLTLIGKMFDLIGYAFNWFGKLLDWIGYTGWFKFL